MTLTSKLYAKPSNNPVDFWPITNLANQDYTRDNDMPFLIKNDGADTVSIQVKPIYSDDWVLTNFYPGWNPELVKAVKQTAQALTLKAGVGV